MAIDAKLLVLDEPTLGLDILYRRKFYETLLNDYFDRSRTIVVTTHQVEEIQDVLTDFLRAAGARSMQSMPVSLDRAVNGFLAKNHAAPAQEGVR
jgi:ABC-2 type transport system ATP-binding protein